MNVAVLGAGPHGREIAAVLPGAVLYDDSLPGFPRCESATEPYVIGAAWPRVRRHIATVRAGTKKPHEMGVVMFPGSIVSPFATIGAHTHVGYLAVISHGCMIGEFVTVCAGVVLGGDVMVGDDVFIGVNASVIHGGITIGQGAVIGAGAVVTRDVPAGDRVAGVPARSIVKVPTC